MKTFDMTLWSEPCSGCFFRKTTYKTNGALAIIVGSEGGTVCYLSCNLDSVEDYLAPGEFFLKDWSENEQVVKALLEKGLIEIVDKPPITSGFVQVRVARLTKDGEQYIHP